jgi:diguanylate cyclase (GGDEF)-like protein
VIDDWANAQRHALALLVVSAQTSAPNDFASFQKAIEGALLLRPVRLALLEPELDDQEIAERLLGAGADPVAAAGFVEAMRPLVALPEFSPLMRLWEFADRQLDDIVKLGGRLRGNAATGHFVGGPRLTAAEALVQIRSASGNLHNTTATLVSVLTETSDHLRWRLLGRGALAVMLGLSPGFLLLAIRGRDRRLAMHASTRAAGFDPSLLASSPIPVWQRDASGATVQANPAFLRLFGVEDAAAAADQYHRWLTAGSRVRAERERERHLKGDSTTFVIELDVPGRSAAARLEVWALPVSSKRGRIESVLEHYLVPGGGHLDSGERPAEGRDLLRQLPVFLWSTDAELRYTSVAGPALPGVVPKLGTPVHHSYDSRSRPLEVLRAHERALRGGSGVFEHELDGSIHRCVVEPLRDSGGRITGAVGVGVEITDHRHSHTRLEQLATRDPLTNLFNRRHFEEELSQALAGSKGTSGGALVWCDLDHFKDINDSLGHSTGDEFLRRVADAFRIQLRSGEILARLGGDEFGVLLPGASLEDATALARRLLDSVRRETLALKARGVATTASIGVVAFPEHGSTTEELLTRADVAMYEAKREGRGRIEVFSYEDHMRPFLSRMKMADQVRACLEQDRMELHLEPICHLRNLRVARYEALLRMPDENGKLLAPDSFLGICETFGLMRDIDRWVIRKACELLRFFRDKGVNIPIEINLSGAAFTDESMLSLIANEVRGGDINPGSLIFEISEKAAVADLRRARHFIEELRRLGCQFAVDDFGAGFSSFGYLRHLPVRYLKIDGSFIRGLHSDAVNQNLVRAIVAMSRSLGVTPVAEFVEDRRTADWLLAESCHFGQGSYSGLARPVADVLTEYATAVAVRWAGRREEVRERAGRAALRAVP